MSGLADLSSRLSTNYPMVLAGMMLAALPMIVMFFAKPKQTVSWAQPGSQTPGDEPAEVAVS